MARGGSYLIEKEGDAPKLVEEPTAPAPAKHKADGTLASAASKAPKSDKPSKTGGSSKSSDKEG